METLQRGEPVRELLVVGGNLALDFANTVDDPDGPARFDHIGDLPGLLGWAQARGLLSSSDQARLTSAAQSPSDENSRQLQRAHDLRAEVTFLRPPGHTCGTRPQRHSNRRSST
jgi:hypothetical protein